MAYQKVQIPLLLLIWVSLTCLVSSLPKEDDPFSILNYQAEAGTWSSSGPIISEERSVELFRLWKEKHGKAYKHAVEAEKRFQAFKNNLKYIMEKNSVKGSDSGDDHSRLMHKVGLNKFADLSNEEYREIYLSKIKKTEKIMKLKQKQKRMLESCDAPSSLDWRKHGIVTGVKDQGQCGSCWSFSSTGAIEGINALVSGELISLSEQELVDCDSTNDGCDGGYMDYAFEWVMSNGGIDSESDYPYTGTDGTCNTAKEDTKVVSIDGYTDVAEEESALLCAVATQPVSVGIDGSTLDFQLYTGGIYDGECSDNPDDIDHAVLIVGYGSEGDKQYWIVKNSWGTDWGIDGYIYIRKNTSETYGVCAINAMASYPTKDSSSSSSPSPFPSPAVPPPPPPPSPSPPSPTPPSQQCGDFSYCSADETCCCLFEFYDYCFIYGCCGYENAVCCSGTEYCCPSDYPVCDIEDLLCLKNSGDYLGVAAKKRKMAKHKLPWTSFYQEKKEDYKPLQWKRNPFASA